MQPNLSNAHLSDDLLLEYLDGALDASGVSPLESHVAACAACAARLARLRGLFNAIESSPEMPLARSLVPGVMARLRVPAPAPRALKLAGGLQLAASLALLLAVLPLFLQTAHVERISRAFLVVETGLAETGQTVLQMAAALPEFFAGFTLSGVEGVAVGPGFVPLPIIALTPLLLSAGALWLVGNGILLRGGLRRAGIFKGE